MSQQIEEQFIAQEMTILEQRIALKNQIYQDILKLLLCDLDNLSATFILKLQRDLGEWYK